MYIELLWWDKSVTVLGFKKCTFIFKKIEIESASIIKNLLLETEGNLTVV